MKLYGKLIYQGNNYFLGLDSKNGKHYWNLISVKPKLDLIKNKSSNKPELKSISDLYHKDLEPYILETVMTSNKDLSPLFRKGYLLETILDEINKILFTKYNDSEIVTRVTEGTVKVPKHHIHVLRNDLELEVKDTKGIINHLLIKSEGLELDLIHKQQTSKSVTTCGTLVLDNNTYYVVYSSSTKEDTWTLISRTSKDDIIRKFRGEQPLDKELYNLYDITTIDLEKYVMESVKKNKLGKIEFYGRLQLLPKVLELVGEATTYSFKTDDITIDERNLVTSYASSVRRFAASNDEIDVSYDKISRQGFAHLDLKYKNIFLSIKPQNIGRIRYKLPYKKLEGDKGLVKKVNSAGSISMPDLELLLDLTWYLDPKGTKVKDYRSIKTEEEFEKYVLYDMIKKYFEDINNGKEFRLSLDTETSGLNIYYLANDNPEKSHIVATPLSWRNDQGVVVFHDMEYFDNLSPVYMFNRLKPFLEAPKGDGLFEIEVLGEKFTIDRNKINLIGHNVLFDGRVLFDNGIKPEWTNDTMQLSFNLNPKAAKGKYNNKLKGITRRVFGHETPELSDVLGKGNEDKYKYIRDEEVAVLYGCADGDYTRKVFNYLRKLISNHHYNVYRAQDMEMLNELYISEYYGLRMDTDKVIDLANKTESDIERIHEFLIAYIGQMIDIENQETKIVTEYKMGGLTDDQFREAFSKIKLNADARYEFEMKPASLRDILFNKLHYPTISYTDKGMAKVDKHVMKKLMSVKNEEPSGQMREDLMSLDGDRVIIQAKEFNNYKYPVAYVLSEYASLYKEFTSYFKPIRDQNMEGRLFKGYSLSRIETYRIMNPSQTMKGSLKELTLPFSDDYYMLDFDMAQVEYRIMVSIAKQLGMVDRLRDPEKDFHTESAATLKNIPAHTVPKDLRKKMKSIHFGIPYGLGDKSLCEAMYGKATATNMYETIQLKNGFCERNDKVIAMLEHHRDEALKPREFSDEFKDFCGMFDDVVQPDGSVKRIYKPVGIVNNALGRYRLFDLSDLDNAKTGIIRRAAGNFPIQAFAAELFRIILLNFRRRCKEEGIEDKIIWHMLIHDELLLSVHKDLNPFYVYKLILEECMVTIDEHTEYFVGINLGSNWAECKDDSSEAPVLFVREMAERWDAGEFKDDKGSWKDCAKSYVDKYKAEFISRRIHEVLLELQPNLDNENLDFTNIRNNMTNYTVRAYITDFYIPRNYTKNGKPSKDWWSLNDDSKLLLALCVYCQEWFGEDKGIQIPDGTIVKGSNFGIGKGEGVDLSIKLGQLDDDELEEDEEDYWAFGAEGFVASTLEFYDDDVYFDEIDNSFKSLHVIQEEPLKHIDDLGKQIVVKIPRTLLLPQVKQALQPFVNRTSGTPLVFKTPMKTEMWLKIDNTRLREIDNIVGGFK